MRVIFWQDPDPLKEMDSRGSRKETGRTCDQAMGDDRGGITDAVLWPQVATLEL